MVDEVVDDVVDIVVDEVVDDVVDIVVDETDELCSAGVSQDLPSLSPSNTLRKNHKKYVYTILCRH